MCLNETGVKVVAETAEAPLQDMSGKPHDFIVLKFGSSVLKSPADLPRVVSELYRHVRHGAKVVAVVSAFHGETDRLFAEAALFSPGAQSRHLPRFISLGEERAASLLALTCEQAGLDARILGARALSLRAGGPIDDAYPESIDPTALLEESRHHDVLIVPGFVAISETGEPVLLGRGGSDLTAVVLASALNVDVVRLVKDVDGVYTEDPSQIGSTAQRYETISYKTARDVAGVLLQPKAIDFAQSRNVDLLVTRLDTERSTRVGNLDDEFSSVTFSRPIRVGVAGLGVIGEGAVLRLLDEPLRFQIVSLLVGNPSKMRHRQINPALVTTSLEKFLAAGPDIVLDAMSSGEVGKELTHRALASSISIVTANKQAIAGEAAALVEKAKSASAYLHYSSAVGGGTPIVETLRRARAAGAILRVEGVVNGTVNYILSAMQGGQSFEAAVKAAQVAGFAEADPSADLSGGDAEAKMRIISFEAFGEEPDAADISLEALTAEKARAFAKSGGAWRQVANVEKQADGRIVATLAYRDMTNDLVFAALQNEGNAARVTLESGNVFVCCGKGAGRTPTVESMLADLGDIEFARRAVQTGA